MTDDILFSHISILPDNLKAEVADFVAILEHKHQPEKKLVKERQFGGLRG
jgi:hypothetical protein